MQWWADWVDEKVGECHPSHHPAILQRDVDEVRNTPHHLHLFRRLHFDRFTIIRD